MADDGTIDTVQSPGTNPMALSRAIEQAAPPSLRISQDDDAVVIGNLRIPKRIQHKGE